MKKTMLALVSVTFLCSACGVRVADDFAQNNLQNTIETAQYSKVDNSYWGEEGKWSTTPDGYPVW